MNVTSFCNGLTRLVCGATGVTVAQGGFKQPVTAFDSGTPNCPPLGINPMVWGKEFGSS